MLSVVSSLALFFGPIFPAARPYLSRYSSWFGFMFQLVWIRNQKYNFPLKITINCKEKSEKASQSNTRSRFKSRKIWSLEKNKTLRLLVPNIEALAANLYIGHKGNLCLDNTKELKRYRVISYCCILIFHILFTYSNNKVYFFYLKGRSFVTCILFFA